MELEFEPCCPISIFDEIGGVLKQVLQRDSHKGVGIRIPSEGLKGANNARDSETHGIHARRGSLDGQGSGLVLEVLGDSFVLKAQDRQRIIDFMSDGGRYFADRRQPARRLQFLLLGFQKFG